ncbi:NAD(P)H-binding protein [Streptomyces sp. SID161]|uniref:NAD(P)-dependent oxidoreductase n=1 Tax=Streptomyces sp. SID161 TaxID=2690251 RepID=UPI0013700530|nr:NAD(P)H-binding protein [Streptomyces sp. SID161]MYW42604.1 NAD(P)H-binding protein [Streptomyces sp. SID161]
MRITVFGAGGATGSRIVAEAIDRNHQVTAVTRDATRIAALHPGARHVVGDALNPDTVAALSSGQDLVISATRPAPGQEQDLAETARALLAGLSRTDVRLILLGGAGSLRLPGERERTVVQDPGFPADWRPIALACNEQLAVCQADGHVDWAYLSPAAVLEPGSRTGTYRVGTDELLVDADGNSTISMEDLAVAVLDEAEHPAHHRARFTVGY